MQARADDDRSTLALKPMGRVNQSPKQRVPVTPQNGDLSPQKKFKKVNLQRLYFFTKENSTEITE